jgi:hypothetical protein
MQEQNKVNISGLNENGAPHADAGVIVPKSNDRKPNRKERRTAASITRKATRATKKGRAK